MVFVKLWGIMSITSALNLMLAQIFRKLYFLVTFMYKLPNSLVFHSKWMMMMICLNCNQRLVLLFITTSTFKSDESLSNTQALKWIKCGQR